MRLEVYETAAVTRRNWGTIQTLRLDSRNLVQMGGVVERPQRPPSVGLMDQTEDRPVRGPGEGESAAAGDMPERLGDHAPVHDRDGRYPGAGGLDDARESA